MNVGDDRERADITDFGKDCRSASAHTPKPTLARSQNHGAQSHAPPSPLHASPMTVEHALSAAMGRTVAALWVSKERWLIDFLKPTFHSTLWNLCDRIMEFGHMNATQHRYRLGVCPVPHGSVDFKVFLSSDPLMPAALGHGKVAQCQTLCWFVFT